MKKKRNHVYHTVESRGLAKKIQYMRVRQKIYRNRWLDLDVKINVLQFQIDLIFRRLHK